MLGFSHALKIADVPFPFPFAQLLGLLLVAWSCFVPIYVANFTQSMVFGPILCFVLFEGLWCLNEVAKELENPFGADDNDVSLPDFHARFVDLLQDMTEQGRVDLAPIGKSDIGQQGQFDLSSKPVPLAPVAPVAAAPIVTPASEPKEAKQVQNASSKLPESCKPAVSVSADRKIEVLDSRLAQISERMEMHLAKIAEDLSKTSALAISVNAYRIAGEAANQDFDKGSSGEGCMRRITPRGLPQPQVPQFPQFPDSGIDSGRVSHV
eukprot:gb/GFBE01022776.1/.p1 GENE.gb/GFBE01022776.1/~~gb/GFBE01022776.1/.p1  ORF type:complete len:266 (+),score=35.22 gb/GFBE01022776.1/:1-798(+)